MFKKLKQKIEEGGEGGFSPIKPPGTIVRSGPCNGERLQPSSPQTEIPSEPSPAVQLMVPNPEEMGELPSHLSSKSRVGYQAVLEFQVVELEQECVTLKRQLSEESLQHTSKLSNLEGKIAQLDSQGTELKMQIVEMELQREMKQQEFEKAYKKFQDKLAEQEGLSCQNQSVWEEQLNQLKMEIEDKERCIIHEENIYTVLEKKAHHFESQLKAYENSSENEVVSRLHHEVADVEQRIKSRNLEIQILERRLASQTKESEDQIERLLTQQDQVERRYEEAAKAIKEDKLARRELLNELERKQQKNIELEREREELKAQLTFQIQRGERLLLECQDLQSNHEKQIQEIDQLVGDKEEHIRDLLHQVKQLRGENVIIDHIPRPPGMARRTTSIGVQTSNDMLNHEPAALTCSNNTGSNTASLGPEDTLEQMRQQHYRLEDELAEKHKIIRVQQQKIMDIQKELRSQRTLPEQNAQSLFKSSPSPPPTITPSVAIVPDVNFQYLKHVVIKFLCSREDEALQLIRAISTLLEFSPQEEEHVKNYLSYRMSWFGVIPPPLFQPSSS